MTDLACYDQSLLGPRPYNLWTLVGDDNNFRGPIGFSIRTKVNLLE